MPKGQKKIATGGEWSHYECPCKYTFDTSDIKSSNKKINLHKKYCKIANKEMMISTGLRREDNKKQIQTYDLLQKLRL
jgi:hypothetical protein